MLFGSLLSLHVGKQRKCCIQFLSSLHEILAELVCIDVAVEDNLAWTRLVVE